MIRKLAAVVVAFGVILGAAGCASSTPEATPAVEVKKAALTFEDGWVRVSEFSDHAGGMTGAFAKITNNTADDITLIGGSAVDAAKVEIHEVVMLDGEMKMQAKDGGIVIPAGESVALEPGGLHVMLMGLKKSILSGDMITMTLDFDRAESHTVTWPAKTSLSGDEDYHSNK